MESLKFAMYYSPETTKYQFKSYPAFVNGEYMYQDMVDEKGIVNKLLVDEHKVYVIKGTKIREELLDTIQEKGPHEVFKSLDEALYRGYEEYKDVYQRRKVYKICSSSEIPKNEITKAGNEIFDPVNKNITYLKYGMVHTITEIAHYTSQALLHSQTYFLENL